VAPAVRKGSPETGALVLSMHFSEELAREVLRSGALGYMLKTEADTDLLEAIDRVQTHQPFFASKLASSMAQSFVGGPPEAGVDEETGSRSLR
jgi:DNA-binding NarL/FixJ family response regulator